jgi:hypothetical protein
VVEVEERKDHAVASLVVTTAREAARPRSNAPGAVGMGGWTAWLRVFVKQFVSPFPFVTTALEIHVSISS